MVSGIILASGLSKRMGTDKLLLPVGGIPIIERVLTAASESGLGEVILVCSTEAVASIGKRYPVKIVRNNTPQLGQSCSIRLGVESADPLTEGYMFIAGDQPFINAEVINRLLESFSPEEHTAVVPLYNGTRGNPVIFAAAMGEKLKGLLGDTGGRVLLKEEEGIIVTVDIEDEKAGMDIDTQEEYNTVISQEAEND